MPRPWTTREEKVWLQAKVVEFREHQNAGTTELFWTIVFNQFCLQFPARVATEVQRRAGTAKESTSNSETARVASEPNVAKGTYACNKAQGIWAFEAQPRDFSINSAVS
jgi:hypothetical protein